MRTRHGKRTWWFFGVVVTLMLVLVLVGTLHVALRWQPRLLGEVEHGEWMQFETFRVRVDLVEVADSFPSAYDSAGDVEPMTDGMQLMLVRFNVERQDPAPENFADHDNAVCRLTIFNEDGLAMDDSRYSGVADSPTSGGCSPSMLDDEGLWGDELNFQSQIVVAVTPDPVPSFTVQVEHLQDDAGDRWISRAG